MVFDRCDFRLRSCCKIRDGRAKRQHDRLTAVDLRRRGVGWTASITSGGSSVKRLCTAAVGIADFDPLAAIQPNRAVWRPASVHCPALARLESFRLAGGGLLLSKWNGHRPHRLRHGSHSPRTRPLLVGTESSNPSPSSGESANYRFLSGQERMQACGVPSTALTRRPGPRPRPSGSRPPNGSIRPFSETLPRAVRHLQSLSRRRALPFSSFSVSSGPSGNVFSHSVPGRFSANG